MAWPRSPKHDPVPFTVLKNLFVWILCSHLNTFEFMAGPRSPTSPVTAQLISRRWKTFSFWCYADFQQPSSEGLIVLPHNTVQLISRCYNVISFGCYEAFHKHSTLWLGRAPPNTAQFLSRCGRTFSFGCYAAVYKHSSLWLGQAPQHPLSRPSSFRGVEESYRLDVMQTFNNVQTNSWSCSPKHGPAHFTMLKKFFVWMVWSFSKTFKVMAGLCSPKHGPDSFTVWNFFLVWLLWRFSKQFKFMAGPHYPKRSSSFHGVKASFCLNGRKIFKTT